MSLLPPADSYRILLVEDSAAEVRLIKEAVKEAQLSALVEFEYAYDGEEASDILDASKDSGKKYDKQGNRYIPEVSDPADSS